MLASFDAAQAFSMSRSDNDETLRQKGNRVLTSQVSVIRSAIHQLGWDVDGEQDVAVQTKANVTTTAIKVFVSHSSKDEALAKTLINLFKAALGLTASQIRCTSVDGYKLPVGANTENSLREEINAADVVVGLITPSSLVSHYVMFELGARWGAQRFVAPLLVGVEAGDLRGPLHHLNALSGDTRSRLIQLAENIAGELHIKPQSTASYCTEIEEVLQAAKAIPKADLLANNAQKPQELRINGHTYVDEDDAEMCSHCLAVELLPVPLQDMNLDGTGRKATCPRCKMTRGNGPPISRHRAERTSRKIEFDRVQPLPSSDDSNVADSKELTLVSPDDFAMRIRQFQSLDAKSINLIVDNNRLGPIHKIRVIVSEARSFDTRHNAFRTAVGFGAAVMTQQDIIQPSCSGRPVPLVRKATSNSNLLAADDFSHVMSWPENDRSEVQRWRLSVRVLPETYARSSAERAVPLREFFAELEVLWDKATNKFSVEDVRRTAPFV